MAAAKPKSKDQATLRLPEPVLAILDQLVAIGVHGSNRSEVVRYFITRGIDELKGKGYFDPKAD